MSASGSYEIVYSDGDYVTFTANAAITAGTFVQIRTDGKVEVAAAASQTCIGWAYTGCTAQNDLVTVVIRGMIVNALAKGAVTAADLLQAGTDGLGGVSTMAAVVNTNAGTVATGVNDTRSLIGVALTSIVGGARGRILVRM